MAVEGTPHQRLINFLEEVRQVLTQVVDNAPQLVPPEMVSDVRESWPEAERDLDNLINAVPSLSEADLERVGLRGVQLEGKLAGFDRVRAIFRRNPTRKWLLRVLSWINSILGSLLKALPRWGEILKEFKEKTENLIKDRLAEELEPAPQ